MSAISKASPFRAMLWKELREGLVWATGVFVLEAAGMACVVASLGTPPGSSTGSGAVAIPSVMDLYPFLSWGALFAGVVIGLAQMLRESRGDRWAFLTHRPVTRSAIFWSKALGGIVLYAAAYGVPLVAAVTWAIWPGHLAVPFDARMLEPAAEDLLCGIGCYFGALYTGARTGRWFSTRGIGLVLAFLCFAFDRSMDSPVVAVVGVLLMLMVVAIAAWGAFIAGGDSRQQPLWGRVAGAATTFVVLVLVYAMGGSLVGDIVTAGLDTSAPFDTAYQVSSQGDALQVVTRISDRRIVAVNDPAGHPLARYADSVSRAELRQQRNLAEMLLRPSGGGVDANYRLASALFLPLGSTNGRTAWYYVFRERAIAVFEIGNARLLGWIGPAGYSAGPAPPAVQFLGSPHVSLTELSITKPLGLTFDFTAAANPVLAFPGAAYRLDFDRWRADTLFAPPSGDSVRVAYEGHVTSPSPIAPAPLSRFDVILTRRSLRLMGPGLTLLSVALDSAMEDADVIEVERPLAAPGRPTFLRFDYASQSSVDDAWLEVGSGGSVVARYRLPHSLGRPNPLRVDVAAGVFIPSALDVTPLVVPRTIQLGDPSIVMPLAITAIIVGFVCGVLGFALCRAWGFRRRRQVIWTVVCIVLGLFGVLLLLAMSYRPAVERCPNCDRRRLVLDGSCPHCGAGFPAPAAIGVEIFDDPRARTGSFGVLDGVSATRMRGDVWAGSLAVVPGEGGWGAVLWKEFREGLPWGAAALAIMAFVAYAAWGIAPDSFERLVRPTTALMDAYPSLALAEAFVALLIGASQSLRERRGDRWAFLVHRPVSPTMLFLGKATVGVVYYLVATAIPVAALIAWGATHLAMPFDARMVLPCIADLVCGLGYYAAALLIGFREARWTGTRWVPLVAALLCTEWVMSAQTAGGALGGCVLGVALLGVAAWAAFVRQGASESQRPVAWAVTGATVGAGLLVAVGLPLIIVLSAFPARSHPTTSTVPAPKRTVAHEITPVGQIAEVVRLGDHAIEVNDLSGHPIVRYADSARRTESALSAGEVADVVWLDRAATKPVWTYRFNAQLFEPLSACALWGQAETCGGPEQRYFAYYVYGVRLIALYDTKPVRLVGWLGPAGFSEGSRFPAIRFPEARIGLGASYCTTTGALGIDTRFDCDRGSGGDNSDLLVFTDGVFRLDFSQPSATLVFAPQRGDAVVSASTAAVNPEKMEVLPVGMSNRDTRMDAVLTTKYLDIISSLGTVVLRRDTLRGYTRVGVVRAMLAPGAPLFLRFSNGEPHADTLAEAVTEIGTGGRALAHIVFPPTTHPAVSPNIPHESLWTRSHFVGFEWQELASVQAVRAIFVDVNRWIPAAGWAIDIPILGAPVPNFSALTPTDRVVACCVVALLAIACGAMGCYRARSRALSPTAVATWTILGATLGLFGMLLMTAMLDAPVREACPVCGHARAVTRERCEHCGAAFDPPQRDGTELFGDDADSALPGAFPPYAGAIT